MDVHPYRTELKGPLAMNEASASTPPNAEANRSAGVKRLSRMEATISGQQFCIG